MLNKKYLFAVAAVTVLSTASMVGCSNKNKSNEANGYVDGTYTKVATEEENGYVYEATMVVEGGKITSIDWDAKDADGNSKKEAAENGTYVMTEDGLNWAEQSEALANCVIENQSIDTIKTDENGKTDAVAGVSITVTNFVELVKDCMDQASAK